MAHGRLLRVPEDKRRPSRYNLAMQVASGKVVHGQVVVEGELPEGADVMLLTLDGEVTFEVDEALEKILLESIAQGERGETISAEDLLREMRSRE